MASSRLSMRFARTILAFLVVFTIAIPAFSSPDPGSAAPSVKKPPKPAESVPTGLEATKENLGAATSSVHSEPLKRPRVFKREVAFWPFAEGPFYGDVGEEMRAGSDVLQLTVGSFDTRGRGLTMPMSLTIPDGDALAGQSRYFLIQFKASATDPASLPIAMKSLTDAGVSLMEYVPNNGYIAKVDMTSLPLLRASSWLQYVKPYQPGYKINPLIGL